MQLHFTVTTIQERFLSISWGRKQNFQESNYALLIFDTLIFLREKSAMNFFAKLAFWGFSHIFFFQQIVVFSEERQRANKKKGVIK